MKNKGIKWMNNIANKILKTQKTLRIKPRIMRNKKIAHGVKKKTKHRKRAKSHKHKRKHKTRRTKRNKKNTKNLKITITQEKKLLNS